MGMQTKKSLYTDSNSHWDHGLIDLWDVDKLRYRQGQSDYTMFLQQFEDGTKTVLIIYVDIIMTGDNIVDMERLKKSFATEFEMKDLESMRYFLGMEVAGSRRGISESQRKYVINLLIKIGMLGYN